MCFFRGVLLCRGCILGASFFFFKQKTAYEMRISDWSSDVCSSDLLDVLAGGIEILHRHLRGGDRAFAGQVGIKARAVVEHADLDNPVGNIGPRRSEERSVGKECVSTCRSRWSPYPSKKKHYTTMRWRKNLFIATTQISATHK